MYIQRAIFSNTDGVVPISAGAIFFSLLLAFSNWIRALMWLIFKVPLTAFFARTHLYYLWLTINKPGKSIYEKGTVKVEKLKAAVEEVHYNRKFKRKMESPDAQSTSDPGGEDHGGGLSNSLNDHAAGADTGPGGPGRYTSDIRRVA